MAIFWTVDFFYRREIQKIQKKAHKIRTRFWLSVVRSIIIYSYCYHFTAHILLIAHCSYTATFTKLSSLALEPLFTHILHVMCSVVKQCTYIDDFPSTTSLHCLLMCVNFPTLVILLSSLYLQAIRMYVTIVLLFRSSSTCVLRYVYLYTKQLCVRAQ